MRVPRPVLAGVLAGSILIPAFGAAGVASAKPSDRSAVTHSAKQVKTVFAADGTVTAVGADTVTVLAKGGTKDVRQRSVTISVPATARIRRDGRAAAVSALQVGDRIAITGTWTGTSYTARIVDAHRTRTPAKTPTTAPTTTPTTQPSVSPSTTPTTEPTEDPIDNPSDDPTTTPTTSPTA